MAFNFTEIIAAETKKQEEANRTGSGGGIGFKTVYPFSNGRLEFRLMGNEPSGLLYRELVFHEYWSDNKKQKVPCLHHMYGLDCPICDAVNNVQNTLDDKDIFGKYGFKKQGIMFAKLLNYSPDNYFGDTRNPAKPNDIVLFMFPKSVINELRNLIVEYQDEMEGLFASNTGRTVSLKIGTQANGFPEYSFFVKGSSASICVDANGAPDDAAYNQYVMNMPNLKEVKFPSSPTEEMMTIHKTIVEEINRKYFGDMVGAPITPPTPMAQAPVQQTYAQPVQTPTYATPAPSTPVQNVAPAQTVQETVAAPVNVASQTPVTSAPAAAPVQAPVQNVASTPVTPAATPDTSNMSGNNERPACFGNNEYAGKCLTCPWESQCV